MQRRGLGSGIYKSPMEFQVRFRMTKNDCGAVSGCLGFPFTFTFSFTFSFNFHFGLHGYFTLILMYTHFCFHFHFALALLSISINFNYAFYFLTFTFDFAFTSKQVLKILQNKDTQYFQTYRTCVFIAFRLLGYHLYLI